MHVQWPWNRLCPAVPPHRARGTDPVPFDAGQLWRSWRGSLPRKRRRDVGRLLILALIALLGCSLGPGAAAQSGIGGATHQPGTGIMLAQLAAPTTSKPPPQGSSVPSPVPPGSNETDRNRPPAECDESLRPLADVFRRLGYLAVMAGGAFGGLIYSISRNRGAVMAHRVTLEEGNGQGRYVKWNLGIWADLLVGMGGGIIIFNLIPQAGNVQLFDALWTSCPTAGTPATLMKILSLALIGGFAGISLFDEAAKRFSRQIEEVGAQNKANRELISQLNEGDAAESRISFLLNRVVDPSIASLAPAEADQLRAAVIKAPLQVRNLVFERCQASIQANRILGLTTVLERPEVQARVSQLEGLSPTLDSLIAAATEEKGEGRSDDLNRHRYLAHKGFICKHLAIGASFLGEADTARRHLLQAEQLLGQAIDCRNSLSAAAQQEFWHYGLDRAFCRFRLGWLEKAREDLCSPAAMGWATSLDPGVVFTNLKGFSPPQLGADVAPSPYTANDFLAWLASVRPELVPPELLRPAAHASSAAPPPIGAPSSQRDDAFRGGTEGEAPPGDGQSDLRQATVGQPNAEADPDHSQSPV